jgi:predicted ArsR family transcriptional regulator
MLETLGTRQQALLRLLLKRKPGMTMEEISRALKVTRTAVRQHLVALAKNGLVAPGGTRPSGGRPEQLFVLSEAGKELFPRRYPWLAQLLVGSIRQESGVEGLRARLQDMGAAVAQRLRGQFPELTTREQKVEKLSELMQDLGYDTQDHSASTSATTIEADNCIFHSLAMNDPEVCAFDLALLSTFADSKVDHQECMARGGHVCRFRFLPRSADLVVK